jgi:hypothetical protein
LDEALDATINNMGILGFNIGFKRIERELFETNKKIKEIPLWTPDI